MPTPRRVAWDACTWIATILSEVVQRPDGTREDRGALCIPLLEQAKAGGLEIATSGLALVEVCRGRGIDEDRDVLSDFFRRDFIILVPVDRQVGTLARELMMDRHPGLRPADATYIAAAIIAQAAELHTFDQALLRLDGRISRLDGGMLQICKPAPPPAAPPQPLAAIPLFDR